MRSRPLRTPGPSHPGRRLPRLRDAFPAPLLGAAALALLVGGCGALPPLPERDVLEESDIGLSNLTQPPAPPVITARSGDEIAAASARAAPDRLETLASLERAERRPGPELAFFFEAATGRAYLAAGRGKALARGEPAETCPAFGAALDRPSIRDATEVALSRCLASRPAGAADCGCRLIVAGEVLLAPPETFDYARGLAARLVGDSAAGPIDLPLVADGPDPSGLPGAETRALALRSAAGPAGGLTIEPDGGARLTLGEAVYQGRWRAEGFRRGRLAGVVGLRGATGRALTLFIGYDPAEVEARRPELLRKASELRE